MDRKALSLGRNQFGQLGQPELKTYEKPTLIADLEHVNVIQAACGRNHSLFLTDTGVVYACGDNKSGQCGIGNNSTQVVQKPTRINYRGPQIIKVGCGAEFSAILDIKGNLHTFGLPEYGQLGKFNRLRLSTWHRIDCNCYFWFNLFFKVTTPMANISSIRTKCHSTLKRHQSVLFSTLKSPRMGMSHQLTVFKLSILHVETIIR